MYSVNRCMAIVWYGILDIYSFIKKYDIFSNRLYIKGRTVYSLEAKLQKLILLI